MASKSDWSFVFPRLGDRAAAPHDIQQEECRGDVAGSSGSTTKRTTAKLTRVRTRGTAKRGWE
jgi:hypothetical protein